MHERRYLRLGALLAGLVSVAALGCDSGDGDDSTEERAATTPTVTERAPKPGGRNEKGEQGDRKEKRGKTVEKRATKVQRAKERAAARREAARDRKADRAFDRAFRESRFERLVGLLPVRRPPLYVEQYITDERGHRLYTAVDVKRFCRGSPARRRAAVRAFHRAADKLMRRRGINDLVQVVTPVAATTENLPPLAVARRGSVSLTKRGRSKGC